MKTVWLLSTPVILTALSLLTLGGPRNKKSEQKAVFSNTGITGSYNTPAGHSDSASSFLRGKTVYKTYCLSCHQFDAGGVENLNPPLIKTPFVLGNKTRIIQIVLKGFDKRVEIEGEQYSNNMPPLNYLTDQQIADVLTYVRNDFGNKATAVKPTEVKLVRGRLAK